MLICKKFWWPVDPIPVCFGEHSKLTEGALYTCEGLHEGGELPDSDTMCPWDGCGHDWYCLVEKTCTHGSFIPYCPNLFRPLNDGDTSLVADEYIVGVDAVSEYYSKRFKNV